MAWTAVALAAISSLECVDSNDRPGPEPPAASGTLSPTDLAALPESARARLAEADRWGQAAEAAAHNGRFAEADSLYRRQFAVRHRLLGPEAWETVESLNDLGSVLELAGDYPGAKRAAREVLDMRRRITGDRSAAVAEDLYSLASVYLQQGNPGRADPLTREALEILKALFGNDRLEVAAMYNNYGGVRRESGDYAAAESLFGAALRIARRVGDPDGEVLPIVSNNLGLVLYSQGKLLESEAAFRESLRLRTEHMAHRPLSVARAQLHLGAVLADLGKLGEAERLVTDALTTRRTLLPVGHADIVIAYSELASIRWAEGSLAVAESLLVSAGEAYESARLRAGTGLERATFRRSCYPDLAAVRLGLGREREAWEAAEAGLGRATLEGLLRSPAGLSSSAGSSSSTASTPSAATNPSAAANVADGGATAASPESFDPSVAACSFPLEQILAALDRDEAIVGWLERPRRPAGIGGGRWGYVLRPGAAVHWAQLPEASADLTARLRAALLRDESREFESLARELFIQRIEPIREHLAGVRRLHVVPSTEMLGVPVEVLGDANARAGDLWVISYAPSATVRTWLAEAAQAVGSIEARRASRSVTPTTSNRDTPTCLVVGDPIPRESPSAGTGRASHSTQQRGGSIVDVALRDADESEAWQRLPFAGREIRAVASRMGPAATVFSGRDANEARLYDLARGDRLRTFEILHFTTHARVHDILPGRSAVLLTPDSTSAADGELRASEIEKDWRLDARLVVLSACNTGLGRRVLGEGYVGLAQTFLTAGARNVIVSLWPVEDESTAMLMGRFYENLLGGYSQPRVTGQTAARPGQAMSIAEALQEAKAWLRSRPAAGLKEYSHPYWWAGFVLVGGAR